MEFKEKVGLFTESIKFFTKFASIRDIVDLDGLAKVSMEYARETHGLDAESNQYAWLEAWGDFQNEQRANFLQNIEAKKAKMNESRLSIQCSQQETTQWESAAQQQGLTMSEWAKKTLNHCSCAEYLEAERMAAAMAKHYFDS